MHEVTCTHCGQVLQISPDACRCSRCGEDLRALIPPHRAAAYFYRRSADLAARGDLPSALAECERGLAFGESSELRLLAAILAKRMGDAATVRAHVAAIPVDDRLRQEAEWLVRSQPRKGEGDAGVTSANGQPANGKSSSAPARNPSMQASEPFEPQQHAPQHPVSQSNGTQTLPSQPVAPNNSGYAAPGNGVHTLISTPAPQPAKGAAVPAPPPSAPPQRETSDAVPRTALWAQRVWGFVALIMLVIAGAMGWTLLTGGPDALLSFVPGLVEGTPNRIDAETTLQPTIPAALLLPTPTPDGGAAALPGAAAGATTGAVTGTVLAPAAGDAQADAPAVNEPTVATVMDLPAVLQASGRPDLALLPVAANIEDHRVRLTGVVTNTAARLDIIGLVQKVSGTSEVVADELQVHLPSSYVVEPGDSLWSIADKFYGPDATSVSTLYEANRDVLPSAQSLQVGMTLQLPRIQ